MCTCHDINFNVCNLCDALFSLYRVGGAKNSFSMVYKFPVKYGSLEDVLCSNHYHSRCHKHMCIVELVKFTTVHFIKVFCHYIIILHNSNAEVEYSLILLAVRSSRKHQNIVTVIGNT